MVYEEIENMVDKYDLSDFPLCGTNEDGENIIIYIRKDENGKYFEVHTFQKNNWIRVNRYYNDGNTEEWFDK